MKIFFIPNLTQADLYIYHMWDYQTPIYDIMEGLSNVVKAGKVRYIGISNCYAWQLAKAKALAEKEGFPQFVSIQGHYNLIFREEERERTARGFSRTVMQSLNMMQQRNRMRSLSAVYRKLRKRGMSP